MRRGGLGGGSIFEVSSELKKVWRCFLSAIGLYGVLAYSVSQRKRQIGVRLALGAKPSKILRLVIRQGLRLVGIGLVFGIIAAAVLVQYIRSVLYGVSGYDPVSLALSVLDSFDLVENGNAERIKGTYTTASAFEVFNIFARICGGRLYLCSLRLCVRFVVLWLRLFGLCSRYDVSFAF